MRSMKTATVWNEDKDLPSFFFPTAGHLAAQVSHRTQRIYHPRLKIGRKNVNAEAGVGGGEGGGEIGWAQISLMHYVFSSTSTATLCESSLSAAFLCLTNKVKKIVIFSSLFLREG